MTESEDPFIELSDETSMPELRKWAIRFWIYALVCDLALGVLFLRMTIESMIPAAVGDRAILPYGLGIIFYLLAVTLTFMADQRRLDATGFRIAIYVTAAMVITSKILFAILQTGVFWVYWSGQLM